MDVDWAESQIPSAEMRVGDRKPGHAHLTLAPVTMIDDGNDGPGPDGLCSDAACVRARQHGSERTIKVELDVEALAVALATALASALDGRELAAPARRAAQPTGPAPVAKRSFWAGAWHADVVLSSIAILVVVIVLLAWTV